jgi:hypothetical protein
MNSEDCISIFPAGGLIIKRTTIIVNAMEGNKTYVDKLAFPARITVPLPPNTNRPIPDAKGIARLNRNIGLNAFIMTNS